MRARIAIVGATTAALALPLTATAEAASRPAPPQSCAVTKTDGGYVVSWSPPTDNGGTPIRKYVVREQGYSWPAVRVTPPETSVLWERELRDSQDIRFVVRAVNKVGASKPCITAPWSTCAEPAPEPQDPEPVTEPEPAPEPEAAPASFQDALLPYSARSFFSSRVDGAGTPVDAARTSSFRSFMRTHPDQGGKGITWPKINLNKEWAMSYYVHKADKPAPVWRLVGGNTDHPKLKILKTQGFHMADDVAGTFPTGDQDRPGVMVDYEFGYTVQFADAVPDLATRTIRVSNAGILWHGSNGLDYRNPQSDDSRNFTSRGRILDSMVVRRDLLDRAVARGTGLGHVLHLFFVETKTAEGFVHPMVGTETEKDGWGAEGERIRLKPSIDLKARGLTGAALAIGRTLQEHGAYLGDNSGSATQIKASQPHHYVGTNLSTNVFKGKITWDDFEVIKAGWQG